MHNLMSELHRSCHRCSAQLVLGFTWIVWPADACGGGPRTATVLVDEFDAGLFEARSNSTDLFMAADRSVALRIDPSDCSEAYAEIPRDAFRRPTSRVRGLPDLSAANSIVHWR